MSLNSLLKNLSNKDIKALKNLHKKRDTPDGSIIQSLVGNNHDQLTEQDITEFFSPIAKVILDYFNQDELYELIIDKNRNSFRYVILKTHTTIFKFTIKENKPNIDAVNCQNLQHFYFASYKDINFAQALDKVLIKLTKQIKYS